MTAGSPLVRQILVGDAAARLADVPASSVDLVLTSPPYFRLRDYDHPGQLGLEGHVDEWARGLSLVADELARILVPTGTFWLNLGDTYATHPREGAPRKSLLLGPERLALQLLGSGWILRNKIVWAKTNPLPTPAPDRLAATYELVYVLARQPRYFFDLDAIRQPHRSRPGQKPRGTRRPAGRTRERWRGPNGDDAGGLRALKARGLVGHPLGKNPGDVWPIGSSSYRGGHHATFPTQLAERIIRAGCPERRCCRCREPWRRRVRRLGATATRLALRPGCACASDREPGLVLDPFMGAGTTAVAAERLRRDWLGIELNPAFAALATARIADERQRREAAR